MLKIGVALAQWSFGENTKNSDDGTIGMGIFVKQMEVTDGLSFFCHSGLLEAYTLKSQEQGF